MTDKELRKLSRQELLEMLLQQTRRTEELQAKLNEAESKLNERQIMLQNAGSIAAAALKLNKVFEAADEAVAQYIESVKKMGQNAVMSDVPKISKEPDFDKMLKDYSSKETEKPKVTTAIHRPEKSENLFDTVEKTTSHKPREIKHLKNN